MVDAFIELNQVALWVSTGRVVIGVFQTLSLGNTGHVVRGNRVPTAHALSRGSDRRCLDEAEEVGTCNAVVPTSTAVASTKAPRALITIIRGHVVDSPHHTNGARESKDRLDELGIWTKIRTPNNGPRANSKVVKSSAQESAAPTLKCSSRANQSVATFEGRRDYSVGSTRRADEYFERRALGCVITTRSQCHSRVAMNLSLRAWHQRLKCVRICTGDPIEFL